MIYAIEQNTGRQIWVKPGKNLAAFGSQIYIFNGSQITAVDGVTGHSLWSRPITVSGNKNPFLLFRADSRGVYIASDTSSATIIALDANTGSQRWQQPLNGVITEDLAVANGKVIALERSSTEIPLPTLYLEALDVQNGEIVYRKQEDGAQGYLAGISDGRIFLNSNGSEPVSYGYVIDEQTGNLLWQTTAVCGSFSDVPNESILPNGAIAYVTCVDSNGGIQHVIKVDASNGNNLGVMQDASYQLPTGTNEERRTTVVGATNTYLIVEDYSIALNTTYTTRILDNVHGKTIWSKELQDFNNSDFAVFGADANTLSALAISTGSSIWPTSFAGDGSGISRVFLPSE